MDDLGSRTTEVLRRLAAERGIELRGDETKFQLVMLLRKSMGLPLNPAVKEEPAPDVDSARHEGVDFNQAGNFRHTFREGQRYDHRRKDIPPWAGLRMAEYDARKKKRGS